VKEIVTVDHSGMSVHLTRSDCERNTVTVDHSGMSVHLTRSDCEGFKKCRTSTVIDETDDDRLWNVSQENGDVRSESEELMADEGR